MPLRRNGGPAIRSKWLRGRLAMTVQRMNVHAFNGVNDIPFHWRMPKPGFVTLASLDSYCSTASRLVIFYCT